MTTTSEILWRVAWMVLGRDPGAGEVPPEAQLARDFDPYGETGREANLYLHTLWPGVHAIWLPPGIDGFSNESYDGRLYALRRGVKGDDGELRPEISDMEAVDAAWHDIVPRPDATTHPLYPLVAAWLDRRKRARIRDG